MLHFAAYMLTIPKGIAWAGVATSLVFFTARIGVRIKGFNKLFADDALVSFACLLLLINSIIWQVSEDDLYLNIGFSSGQIFPPPVDFPERTTRYLRRTIVVIAFFYTGLWAINLSFLIFFRRLGHNVRNQKPVWWTVLAITVATYFACLGIIEYHCLAGSFEYVTGEQTDMLGMVLADSNQVIAINNLGLPNSKGHITMEHDYGCPHRRFKFTSLKNLFIQQ